jgi:hypothetical protein
MIADPHWKEITELIYYIADHRPTAPTPLVAEAFLIDWEAGDQWTTLSNGDDEILLREKRKDLPDVRLIVTVPRGSYLYRVERNSVRRRRDDEPLSATPVD